MEHAINRDAVIQQNSDRNFPCKHKNEPDSIDEALRPDTHSTQANVNTPEKRHTVY